VFFGRKFCPQAIAFGGGLDALILERSFLTSELGSVRFPLGVDFSFDLVLLQIPFTLQFRVVQQRTDRGFGLADDVTDRPAEGCLGSFWI
jgi:hypothetical protein